MRNVAYYIVYGFFFAVSLLPLRVLYALSDVAYYILYYVVRYRRKIVRKNIANSFPEKGKREVKTIEQAFYHWLCDYFNETIKLLSISEEAMRRHIEFKNLEKVEEYFDAGRSCAAILGHYCNWEWLSTTSIGLTRHKEAITGLIYHPLFNKVFDHLFITIRSAMGGTCIPKKKILRTLVNYRQKGIPTLFGYIADQCPTRPNIHLWLDFMAQDTPVFTGAERIMRSANDVVFFVRMERPKRGRYICTFELITDDINTLEEHEATKRFFALLEESIRHAPQYYLWSHNRWKHNRQ